MLTKEKTKNRQQFTKYHAVNIPIGKVINPTNWEPMTNKGPTKLTVKVVDPLDDKRWDVYVKRHPQGTIYHHSAWKEVIDKSFPQVKPFYLLAEDSHKKVMGVAPFFQVKSWLTGNRLVSLPFSLYSDPLVKNDDVLDLLIHEAKVIQKNLGASYFEIRTKTCSKLAETELRPHNATLNYKLDLKPDLETLKHSFHKSCIRQRINRAEKRSLHIRFAENERDLNIFFELNCMTRKKFGVPPHPYSFFLTMWSILKPLNMMDILIQEIQNEPIAAILYIKYNKKAHGEYMGVNGAYRKYDPNISLYWSAINKLKQEEFRSLDFGSTSIHNEGLKAFKSRWGTVEETLTHYYYPDVQGISVDVENSTKYRLFTSVCRAMPISLFKATGSYLYRHLGG